MSKSILYFYEKIVVGELLREEYSDFVARARRRDYSREYDEDEKKIYMFPFIYEGGTVDTFDPNAEPQLHSFYDKIKGKVLSAESDVKERIKAGFEEREYNKDRKVFLDYLYKNCLSLISHYDDCPDDSELKEHPEIIRSLKRIKGLINDLYETSNIDKPSSISDPNEFERKSYRSDLISQDEVVRIVRKLLEEPRFRNDKGEPKPTTLRDEILNENLINNCEEITSRGLFNRVKDALEEISFYEARSSS